MSQEKANLKQEKILSKLFQKTEDIINSETSWESKYDKIFSDEISKKVFSMVDIDYSDPDTSYEEDAKAFYECFRDYMKSKGFI